jgi:hypothetical protein
MSYFTFWGGSAGLPVGEMWTSQVFSTDCCECCFDGQCIPWVMVNKLWLEKAVWMGLGANSS